MTITNQIDKWIKRHGSCRGALNAALAQIEADEAIVRALPSTDCPQCGGIMRENLVCPNCGYDPNWRSRT